MGTFSQKAATGILQCTTKFPNFVVLLLVVLTSGPETEARNAVCSGVCSSNALRVSSHCTDSTSCIEGVNHENKVFQTFADDYATCSRENVPVFPAYIEKVSASVLNKTFSVNISWKWQVPNITRKIRGYEVIWGLQFIISSSVEYRTNCYSISLSETQMQQGMLSMPCMKFSDDGFSAHEFKITSLAFVVQKLNPGLLMTPNRLQEVVISKEEGNLTDVTVTVWNPLMEYNISDQTIIISFTPAPPNWGYTSYDIRVFKATESNCVASAPPVDKINVVPSWPTTSVNFNTGKYKECAKYCASVHPVRKSSENQCSGGCVKEMNNMIVFNVPPRNLKCRVWNANFSIEPKTWQSALDVAFNVSHGYEFCFKDFIMQLCIPSRSDCGLPRTRVAEKTFHWNSSVALITFEGLAPGNYCVVVRPGYDYYRDPVCRGDKCYVRFSNIHRLLEPHAEPISAEVPQSPVQNEVLMIATLSVIGVIVLITVAGILFQKSRPRAEVKIGMAEFFSTDDHEPLNPSYSNPQREVTILYTHDEPTRNQARALANFLKHQPYFEVMLDEDHLPEITADHTCFLSEAIKYSCPVDGESSHGNDNKRIIIVESKRAEKLLRKKETIMEAIREVSRPGGNGGVIHSERDENLSSDEEELSNISETLDKSFFYPAISSITNTRKHITDDCHIFIVQFGDATLPGSGTFNRLFPGKRYCLTRHLGDLCLNLNRINYPRDLSERHKLLNQMFQQWRNENHESYRELLAACHRGYE